MFAPQLNVPCHTALPASQLVLGLVVLLGAAEPCEPHGEEEQHKGRQRAPGAKPRRNSQLHHEPQDWKSTCLLLPYSEQVHVKIT